MVQIRAENCQNGANYSWKSLKIELKCPNFEKGPNLRIENGANSAGSEGPSPKDV